MMVFFEHAFKRTMNLKLLVAGMLLFPVFLAAAPHPQAAAPPIGFTLYGLIILFSGFLLTKQTIEDRSFGTITRIAAAPIRHWQYLIGHLFAYWTILFIQNLIFIIIAYAIWHTLDLSFVALFITYNVFSVLALTFALFWHMLFRSYATSIAVYSVIINMVAIIGGLIVPIAYMPEDIKRIAIILPTYWFSYAVQTIYDSEAFLQGFLALLIVAGFAIIFLVIGSKRRLE